LKAGVVFDFHLFAQYPRAVSILLTWLIPYGFASFIPAGLLLVVAYQVWQVGLRQYSSTGS
jgi:ABC-2 type transport system permease protein